MTATQPAPERADFRFLDRLRVRWAEVDMQKIVFNGHYLMYFDTAIAGYWRALALPYHETMQGLQGDLYVRKATVEYEGSARYDDVCEVGVRCARIGNSSMVFGAAVLRGETRLVHGELVYVFADPATQTSRPVPQKLRAVLEAFEAGAPMLDCRTGPWPQLGGDARPLRQAAFVVEQGLPASLVEDAADASALHAVAYNHFGLAVGTGRLTVEAPACSRIGRLAVLGALRGAGVGGALVRSLVGAARARGDHELVLAASVPAQRFYERLGFAARGARFAQAGLMHQEMVLIP